MICSTQIKSYIETANDCISASKIPQVDTITFDWNEMHFHAISDPFGANSGMIKLTAVIGRLYFTIEDEHLRQKSIIQLQQNNRYYDGSYTLEKDGSITFDCLTATKEKVRGNELIKALTLIMLESSEHIMKLRAYLKAV